MAKRAGKRLKLHLYATAAVAVSSLYDVRYIKKDPKFAAIWRNERGSREPGVKNDADVTYGVQSSSSQKPKATFPPSSLPNGRRRTWVRFYTRPAAAARPLMPSRLFSRRQIGQAERGDESKSEEEGRERGKEEVFGRLSFPLCSARRTPKLYCLLMVT